LVIENDQARSFQIYWSEEDEAFVAEAPKLPGCAAHGDTQESARGNALDAIASGLIWRINGDPIPEPKGRRLIFA